MTIHANTVLTVASIFLIVACIVALVLAAPALKRPKQSHR